ncbi:MAG TPA: porin, partial [Pseudolabrys sp.]|nr:porin [Pseudolabrys sp.]
MKICSLYGAGFYYIPGTDTCIKVGGFVRSEWLYNSNGSFGPYTADQYTRATSYIRNRSRFVLSMDVRSQTEYG